MGWPDEGKLHVRSQRGLGPREGPLLPASDKAEATEFIAGKGIHILMDKPMAANFDQARRIYDAAEKSGIKLLVNWPTAWRPALTLAHSLVQEGEIGRLFSLKARTASPGPEIHGASDYFLEWLWDNEKNGGGALVDYCCYDEGVASRGSGDALDPVRRVAMPG